MKKLPKDHSRRLLKWLPYGSKVRFDRKESFPTALRYTVTIPTNGYPVYPDMTFQIWIPTGTHLKECVIVDLITKVYQLGKESGYLDAKRQIINIFEQSPEYKGKTK